MYFDLVDRPGHVAPVTGGADEDRPPFGEMHVVTAIQPDADRQSADSAARMAVLDQELADAELRFMLVLGASIDGEHAEDSGAGLIARRDELFDAEAVESNGGCP